MIAGNQTCLYPSALTERFPIHSFGLAFAFVLAASWYPAAAARGGDGGTISKTDVFVGGQDGYALDSTIGHHDEFHQAIATARRCSREDDPRLVGRNLH